jgi:predicted acylesterase/phospholipase RssA
MALLNGINPSLLCVASAQGERGGAPVCLRTYLANRNSIPDCTIVEAVRATCATPGLFKPTDITEPGGIKVSYVGLGHNNPAAQLLNEAAHVFPDLHLSCVVSVSAGYTQTPSNQTSSYLPSPTNIESLDYERIAQEISVRFEDIPGIYFRFSIDLGLKNARSLGQEMSDAVARARWYLRIPDTDKKVSDLVQVLEEGKCAVLTRDLSEYIL